MADPRECRVATAGSVTDAWSWRQKSAERRPTVRKADKRRPHPVLRRNTPILNARLKTLRKTLASDSPWARCSPTNRRILRNETGSDPGVIIGHPVADGQANVGKPRGSTLRRLRTSGFSGLRRLPPECSTLVPKLAASGRIRGFDFGTDNGDEFGASESGFQASFRRVPANPRDRGRPPLATFYVCLLREGRIGAKPRFLELSRGGWRIVAIPPDDQPDRALQPRERPVTFASLPSNRYRSRTFPPICIRL